MKARFEEIYRQQKDTVYGYLYYMTKNEQTAADLSQETFLKVYRSMGRFREQCSEKTWCLTIARNTFLTYSHKKQPIHLEQEEWDKLPDNAGMPEQAVLHREEQERIRKVLLSLSEDDRTVLLLRDYESLSYKEIGEMLGVSEVVVKGRIFRARNRFKDLYAGSQDK